VKLTDILNLSNCQVASEMGFDIDQVQLIYGDNEKAIEYLNGTAQGKGMRHAQKRLSYMRDDLAMSKIKLIWMSGKSLIVDALTKVTTHECYENFRYDAMGWQMLETTVGVKVSFGAGDA
jgi:hypothetical protein